MRFMAWIFAIIVVCGFCGVITGQLIGGLPQIQAAPGTSHYRVTVYATTGGQPIQTWVADTMPFGSAQDRWAFRKEGKVICVSGGILTTEQID